MKIKPYGRRKKEKAGGQRIGACLRNRMARRINRNDEKSKDHSAEDNTRQGAGAGIWHRRTFGMPYAEGGTGVLPITPNLRAFVMRPGKPYINMLLPWRMELGRMYFILVTGSANPVLLFAAVMMDCAR